MELASMNDPPTPTPSSSAGNTDQRRVGLTTKSNGYGKPPALARRWLLRLVQIGYDRIA